MDSKQPLVVAYELKLEDVQAFDLHYARTARLATRTRRQVRLALTSLLAVLLVTLNLCASAPAPLWFLGLAILGAWYAAFPRRVERLALRHTARMYAEGRNAGLLGPHRLELEPEWLVERSPLREVRTHWRAVEKVVLEREHIFIYVSGFTAVIVPVRAFASEAQRHALLAAIEERQAAAPASPG